MIKEILEQLAPLDAQIAALKGSGNDMEAITAHASELAELAVEEDEILRSCGPLTAEDRVFLARVPRITWLLNTMDTPGKSSEAQRKASVRLILESVESKPMGFCAPVRMMDLGLP